MAKFFTERPIFATVVALAISIIGLFFAVTLPVDRYPNITPPQVSVTAMYPGADAEVVANTVAEVIEKNIAGVENVNSVSSSSNANGFYMMGVQFLPGTDSDMAAIRVQNAVAGAEAALPDTVRSIGVITKKSAGDMALVVSISSPHGTYDSTFLKNYFSMNYLDELKAIPGVGTIQEFGSDFAMRIWIDPAKMSQYKLTAPEIIGAIKSQNQQVAAGSIGTSPTDMKQSFQYIVTIKGRLTTEEEFGNIVVRANPDGSLIHLKDVAKVELDARNHDFIATDGNHHVTALAFSLADDANAIETIGKIKEKIEEDSHTFPEDMTYSVVLDNTEFIYASLKEVRNTFIEALCIVAMIVFLFLQNWRSTLIPMIAVPVSLLGTFISFAILGFTINTLTLFAMVLAIGLVIDDAIVVIEAVEYEMRHNHLSAKEATLAAMKKVQNPVIGVALVLSAVFVPVAFLGGIVGVLYEQFALTIAVSVLISAFVALSLTPALCAGILKPVENGTNLRWGSGIHQKFNHWMDKKTEAYGRILCKLWHIAVAPFIVLVGLTVASVAIFIQLPTAFIPAEDNGYFVSALSLPEGAVNHRTAKAINAFVKYMQEQPGVKKAFGVVGFDPLSGGVKSNAGASFIKLEPWSERKEKEAQLGPLIMKAFAYNAAHPEVKVMAMNPPAVPGLGSTGGFSLYIQNKKGASVENMQDTIDKFLAEAQKRPEIQMVYTTFHADTPSYKFDIDREKVQKSGVNLADVYMALQVYYGSAQINDFTTFGKNFKVVAQAEAPYRMSPEDNKFLTVRNNQGQMIPISQFITTERSNSISVITRYNNFPAIKIGGMQAAGYTSGQALNALEQVAKDTLPFGYSIHFSGTSEQEKMAETKTLAALSLGILFVFLALAALYESWKVPFAVILGMPTGFFGACLGAWILNVSNDIYFQIGLLTIIGLAAKNAILIVEYAKVRVDAGMEALEAAVEASKIRLRPILMTSLAFIMGSIPLALSGGAGGHARFEMGVTVVLGVLSATIFQIFIVPLLFVGIEKLHGKTSKNVVTMK